MDFQYERAKFISFSVEKNCHRLLKLYWREYFKEYTGPQTFFAR